MSKALVKDIRSIRFSRNATIILAGGSTPQNIQISDNCIIYGCLFSSNKGIIHLGEYCQIGSNSVIRAVDKIIIGAYTAISNNVVIQDNNSHPVNPLDRLIVSKSPPGSWERGWINSDHKPIAIGKNCWIGENSRICKGVNIGDGSIVAANAVVTKSVPPNCIVAGNPAKIVKQDIDKTSQRYFTD